MSINEMEAKIQQLKDLESLIQEAQEEAESIKDSLKAQMLAENTEEMTCGRFILRWSTVLSNRFDTTAFKKVMPEVYKAYTKQVHSRRFSIA